MGERYHVGTVDEDIINHLDPEVANDVKRWYKTRVYEGDIREPLCIALTELWAECIAKELNRVYKLRNIIREAKCNKETIIIANLIDEIENVLFE